MFYRAATRQIEECCRLAQLEDNSPRQPSVKTTLPCLSLGLHQAGDWATERDQADWMKYISFVQTFIHYDVIPWADAIHVQLIDKNVQELINEKNNKSVFKLYHCCMI